MDIMIVLLQSKNRVPPNTNSEDVCLDEEFHYLVWFFLCILTMSVPGNRAIPLYLLDGWEDRGKPREHLHIHKDHTGAFVSPRVPEMKKQTYFYMNLETWALSARMAGGQMHQ